METKKQIIDSIRDTLEELNVRVNAGEIKRDEINPIFTNAYLPSILSVLVDIRDIMKRHEVIAEEDNHATNNPAR